MPTLPNTRIYYATQAVQLLPQNSDGSRRGNNNDGKWVTPQGIQSVGMTTNFNLTQLFSLGQLELYDNVEGTPEVEVTMQKTLDGTLPLYLLCMGGTDDSNYGANRQISDLSTNRVNFLLGIYPDTVAMASGNATHFVGCSGMYLSSVGYTLPIDGFATEDVTLVGNNKVWNSGLYGESVFNSERMTDLPDTGAGSSITAPNVVRRVNVKPSRSVLPTGVAGIRLVANRTAPPGMSVPAGYGLPYFQSISVKANLGREAINELGAMAPYTRYVKFPLEITSEFNVISSEGDYVDANDFNNKTDCSETYTNLKDKEIKIVICGTGTNDNMTIDLGPKNKLTSVNYTGGDTGGGNATVTYSFQTFNYFKVNVSGSFADPSGTKFIG